MSPCPPLWLFWKQKLDSEMANKPGKSLFVQNSRIVSAAPYVDGFGSSTGLFSVLALNCQHFPPEITALLISARLRECWWMNPDLFSSCRLPSNSGQPLIHASHSKVEVTLQEQLFCDNELLTTHSGLMVDSLITSTFIRRWREWNWVGERTWATEEGIGGCNPRKNAGNQSVLVP